MMLYKMINDLTPGAKRATTTNIRQENEYDVRESTKLTAPKTSTKSHYNSFLPMAIKEWNKLPRGSREQRIWSSSKDW